MKHTWLLLGFMCLFSCWISSTIIRLVFLLVMTWYYGRHYRVHPCFLLFLCGLLLPLLNHQTNEMPVSKTLHIKEIKSGYAIADNGEQRIVLYGAKGLGFDDIVEVEGTYMQIDTIHNLDMFSFQEWLNRRDIHYQLQAKQVHRLKQGTSLRNRLYSLVQECKDTKGKNWVLSMLYQIHEEDVSYFITASGMHLSLLAYGIEKALSRFLPKTSCVCIVLFMLSMAGVATVFSTSLIRVICFRLTAFLFDKDSSQDKLGKSMCLVLMLFPYMGFELAFLLPTTFRLLQLFQRVRVNRTFISFVVMIPFQFLYFHNCDLIQILLFRFLRPCYAILYAMAWLYTLTRMDLILQCAVWLMSVWASLQNMQFLLYYTPSLIWLISWTMSVLRYMTYKKKGIILVALFLYTMVAPYMDPFGEIMMLDVGQGDCTLIILPYHQGVLLIDVMGSRYKNIPKDIIVPVLRSRGIRAIDKVIITHEDYDHSGGLKELQKLIEVKEVIDDKREMTQLHTLRIPFILSNYKGKDENDNSILTYIEIYGLRLLFMGDAGVEVEEELMESYAKLKADIIKVGHHGSVTSSSLAFLHQLDARIALISAGRNNRYGHPHKEVLNRLKQEDIYAFISAVNGGVSIKFCKYFAFFRTADNEFGIMKYR